MNISVQTTIVEDNKIILSVAGEVDVYTAPQLKEKLLSYCVDGNTITVDLTRVDYIDSTGLGVLISAYRMQKDTNGRLILTGMNARLKRLFQITGLSEVMEIEAEKQGAGES